MADYGGVVETIDDLHARIAQLEAALHFYGNERNYIDGICEEGTTAIDDDCGTIARAALEGKKPK